MNFADVSEENLEFFRHIKKFGKFCRSEENLEIFRHVGKFGDISPTHPKVFRDFFDWKKNQDFVDMSAEFR